MTRRADDGATCTLAVSLRTPTTDAFRTTDAFPTTDALSPPPAVSYTPRKAWDAYVPSNGRHIRRNLLAGSDGTYKVVATDHDAVGNSNGGSVCIFNAGGWSDCVSNVGDRYQLKPASIRWLST
jgi:hypothetical protein